MGKVVNIYKDKYDVYIGRAGKGKSGYFGNPIIVGKVCPICGKVHRRGGTLECYEKYLRDRIEKDPEFKEAVKNLQGKTLGCFCTPRRCHGEVLINIVEELNNNE